MSKDEFITFINTLVHHYNENHDTEFFVVMIRRHEGGYQESYVLATPNRCPLHFAVASAVMATAHAKELVKAVSEGAKEVESIYDKILEDLPKPREKERGS